MVQWCHIGHETFQSILEDAQVWNKHNYYYYTHLTASFPGQPG